MKNLTVKVNYRTESETAIICTPWNETIEFSTEKTATFEKYGDDLMLKIWCESVLKLEHPAYNCSIINIARV